MAQWYLSFTFDAIMVSNKCSVIGEQKGYHSNSTIRLNTLNVSFMGFDRETSLMAQKFII